MARLAQLLREIAERASRIVYRICSICSILATAATTENNNTNIGRPRLSSLIELCATLRRASRRLVSIIRASKASANAFIIDLTGRGSYSTIQKIKHGRSDEARGVTSEPGGPVAARALRLYV